MSRFLSNFSIHVVKQGWLTSSLISLCVQCHVSLAHGWHPAWAEKGRCPSHHCQTPALTCRPWSAHHPTHWWPISTTPAPARPPAAPTDTFQSEASGSYVTLRGAHSHQHHRIQENITLWKSVQILWIIFNQTYSSGTQNCRFKLPITPFSEMLKAEQAGSQYWATEKKYIHYSCVCAAKLDCLKMISHHFSPCCSAPRSASLLTSTLWPTSSCCPNREDSTLLDTHLLWFSRRHPRSLLANTPSLLQRCPPPTTAPTLRQTR